MSVILDPYISNKRNRLRAFNEDEKENGNIISIKENEIEIIQKISSPPNIIISTTSLPPITNLKIIENKKDVLINENSKESSHQKEKKGTTTSSSSSSSSREFSSSSRHIETKRKPEDGKKIVKNIGFSTRLSTMWEDMKRLMGFSPDCLNVCANGGKRIKEKSTGFGGIQTEEEICKCTHPIYITGRHCEQVNCQNGGKLLSDGNCQCADGWYSGTFCQYYTSSWLVAIGIPLLFIALVIFCCVVCRMDLCSLCRSRPVTTQRMRPNERRPRRRQHQQNCPTAFGNCRGVQRPHNGPNRSRLPNDNHLISNRRQQNEEQLQNLYTQQNLLNAQQQENQQYVLRLERFPMLYNPNCTNDKPLDPPPPYEQAILCVPTPLGVPPNYYNLMSQHQTVQSAIPVNPTVQEENVESINEIEEEGIILEEENIAENNQQESQQSTSTTPTSFK
uniref:EGF-like domain-containing protein n=1 Tax=Meloidogyne hapla TaxID=6305 RepID=A0A1I8BW23_MELHA